MYNGGLFRAVQAREKKGSKLWRANGEVRGKLRGSWLNTGVCVFGDLRGKRFTQVQNQETIHELQMVLSLSSEEQTRVTDFV